MNKLKFLIPSFLLAVALSSCDINTNRAENGDNWYTAKDLTSKITYKDIHQSYRCDAIESHTDTNILVLPIEFSGMPFNSYFLDDLDNALNGDGEDDTNYWESLFSFYYKSSFGDIKLNCVIADIYEVSYTPQQAYNLYGKSSDYGRTLIQEAFNEYKENNDTTKFDADGDGFVDAVIAVYSCNNCNTYSWDEKGFYWAYTYWFQGYDASGKQFIGPNVDDPTLNAYVWLSFDFFYQAVTHPAVDAHTIIHEAGHLFGLDDYYSDSGAPSGGVNMMDLNTHDHDVWSKLALGWANPKVPTGSCTITLYPSQDNGDCILLPCSSWNGSVWDEYIIIELYTPTGLNYLDSKNAYLDGYPTLNKAGIKLWHIDARLVEATYADKSWTYQYLEDLDDFKIDWYGNTVYYVASSNCFDNYIDEDYELIHLIDANNKKTSFGGNKTSDYATTTALFQSGDTFSLNSTWSKFFPNGTKMNNGESFPWEISFDTVTSSYATITVTAL